MAETAPRVNPNDEDRDMMNPDDERELATFDLKYDRDALRKQYSEAIASLPNYKRSAAWEYVACLERLVTLQRKALEASNDND